MTSTVTYNTAGEFDQLYFRLRQKERRIYTDESVANLPFVHANHIHHKEWAIRRNSQKALVNYIKHKRSFAGILEIGCGNGWLSACIAKATGVEVTGLDINPYELEQAKRVFKHIPNLNFLNGSLQTDELKDERFDMILFAASIQYFPSLKQIVDIAIEHLTLQGEVHILDSPFYQLQEVLAARQRTKEYFKALGFTAMADHYYHHDLSELEGFQYKILHHPHSWKNKLSIKKNPFYWIAVKNRYQ